MKWAPQKLSALFYVGLFLFVTYQILKVYFIMPFPGSQKANTLALAYYLNRWSLFINIFLLLITGFGAIYVVKRKKRWVGLSLLLIGLVITFFIRTKVQADAMFKSPVTLIMAGSKENTVDTNSIVIGLEVNGDAKAFPIKFLAYHHIILDRIGNQEVMITYCDVCHSGRVYAPIVNGQVQKFRLVGMDHFNAMFEDKTGSWWRQESGECVEGPLKGERLTEIISMQMTVAEWYRRYPNGKIMQPDPHFLTKYDMTGSFEKGKDKSALTRTDSLSWKAKSLVVGVTFGSASKAYDWNELIHQGVINDEIANQKIVVVVNPDGTTFSAFFNNTGEDFILERDILKSGENTFDMNGNPTGGSSGSLTRLHAYQEFWHSWKTFHPETKTYPEIN